MRAEREIDLPEAVEALRAAFADYERALADNDVAKLNDDFWASDLTVRFGIADQQFGIREIADWRALQMPLPVGRDLERTRVTTFGDTVGVVTTLFRYPGSTRLGRQSQTWIRFREGWRIVSAHVSEVDAAADP